MLGCIAPCTYDYLIILIAVLDDAHEKFRFMEVSVSSFDTLYPVMHGNISRFFFGCSIPVQDAH